jgi:hypothetical protein
MRTLSGNPETREPLQRLLKKANPALSIPELDAADRVRAESKVHEERIARLEHDITEDRVRRRLEADRAAIKTRYGLTDEDVVKIEAMMVDPDPEKRIPTYDAAARVYKAERTPSTPTPTLVQPPTFEMPETDTWKGGIGNKSQLDKIALKEAYSAWNDVIGQRSAA